MAVEQKKQEIISNNLANSNTTGFKKEIPLVRSSPELPVVHRERGFGALLGASGQGALLDTVLTVYSQGDLEQTGRPLDLALAAPEPGGGTAFFTVATPQGNRYTRDGRFSLDREGALINSDGYRVLGIDGNPLFPADDRVQIDQDGVIRQGEEEAGQLALRVFAGENLAGLQKRGDNLFEDTRGEAGPQAAGQLRQGFLERPNLNMVSEMINMLEVMRTYEANQKTLQAQDELLGKSANELGSLR
jgi:flagellar basal-body rod protein FlgG